MSVQSLCHLGPEGVGDQKGHGKEDISILFYATGVAGMWPRGLSR